MTTSICPEELCTGCAACSNVCPLQCIDMVSNLEGFLYPNIDLDRCINCGSCKRTCPVNNIKEPEELATPRVYACWNKDEDVRFQSASGGVFSALASYVLDNDGVVFGAAYNENMKVEHISVTKKEELSRLRSSKYVQSDIGSTYIDIKKLLSEDRMVLFSGTPCQVAGLYGFLGRDNKKLITCDMLCKGVPSPGLFAKYVDNLQIRYKSELININFRYKREGWNLASTVVAFSDGQQYVLEDIDNSFMYGFANSFTLRSSCYKCSYTNINRTGDITLGDFWGIGGIVPFNHNIKNGISLIILNSKKGQQIFKKCLNQIHFEERTLKEAMYGQGTSLSNPVVEPKNREEFFTDYEQLEYNDLAKKHLVDKGLKRLIKRIVPRTWIFHLQKFIGRI